MRALRLMLLGGAVGLAVLRCNPADFKGYSYNPDDPEACGAPPASPGCGSCVARRCCSPATACFGGPGLKDAGASLPTRSQCADYRDCLDRNCAEACAAELSPVGPDAGDAGASGAGGCADVCGAARCGSCPAVPMVTVGSFQIDSTEVTNAQYKAWLATNPSTEGQPAACAWNTDFGSPAGEEGRPVGSVDWCDALAYCRWAGKRLCGKIGGGSVSPTEFTKTSISQWFAACVGPANRLYPYGDTYQPKACNGADLAAGDTVFVSETSDCSGGFAGLVDMSGNVAEWEDSCGGDQGAADLCRVRGGSWHDGGLGTQDANHDLACTADATIPRQQRYSDVGFRCCSAP